MTSRVRIGAVSYLNAKPLVLGFEEGLGADRVELAFGVPAALAARLAAFDLDVALLPAVELGRIPDLVVVPGLSIASRGAAASVLLVTRKPLDRIQSVALDPESQTSNALVRVLFAEAWGATPEFHPATGDLAASLREHDAVVRIGDKALFEPLPPRCEAVDLGEAWTSRTKLPFVFAVWAARAGAVDRDLYQMLHASRRRGTAELGRIAESYAWRDRTYPARSYDYLSRRMFYRLGALECRGLERFLGAAHRAGLAPLGPELRWAKFSAAACGEAAALGDRVP